MLTKKEIKHDLIKLGIKKGDILNVKASLKSIGVIKGGAKTLLECLLEVVDNEGTIVTESFIRMYPLISLRKKAKYISTQNTISYAGAFVNAMLSNPKVYRSTHPVQKFAAIGFHAKELMENFSTPKSIPYEVLKVMISKNAKNLRVGPVEKVVGVGTTHVAIDELGVRQKRLPYGIYYYNNSKLTKYKPNWPSGCSNAFNALIPYYKNAGAIISEGKIGNAISMLTDMKKTYETEIDLFTKDINLIMCDDPGCPRCRIGWENSKGKFLDTLIFNLKQKNINKIIQTLWYQFNNNYQPS